MDRVARIIGVWIVGCMIVGGALVIANIPLATEAWTDQRVLLIRLGLVAIGLGVLGIVAEILYALQTWRGRVDATQPLVSVSPETLCGYFVTFTGIQAKQHVAPYLGQPIQVAGPVFNVTLDWGSHVSFRLAEHESILVFARFGRRWSGQLRMLNKGQTIEVIGKIDSVDMYMLTLRDCRLVSPPDG